MYYTSGHKQITNYAVITGLVLTIVTYCAASKSGGLFNPAVTLALVSIGVLKPILAIWYISGQILASLFATL